MELAWPGKLAVWVLPVLFAITVHEVAHGWVARALGDRTAEMLGRLTLNPVRHIDPVGTVLVPCLLFMAGGFIIGWAKPVPVAVRNLRHPKRDMALVAAAGPAANLLMALIWAVVARLGVVYHHAAAGDPGLVPVFIVSMGVAGIVINTILMVINLLPIPPLDGGRVLAGVLPQPLAARLERLERFGLILVIVLLVTGALGGLLGPVLSFVIVSILDLVQMPHQDFAAVHALIRPRWNSL